MHANDEAFSEAHEGSMKRDEFAGY